MTHDVSDNNLQPDEYQVYSIIAKHFVASLSEDANFTRTETMVKTGDEIF